MYIKVQQVALTMTTVGITAGLIVAFAIVAKVVVNHRRNNAVNMK